MPSKSAKMVQIGWIERLGAFGDVVTDLDVSASGERRKQIELLEDKADARLAHAGALGVIKRDKIDAVDEEPSGARASEAAEDVEERRLSAARGADDD